MKNYLLPLIFFVSISLSACGTSNSGPTSIPPLTLPPIRQIAECTAQSEESEDLAQPGDWISGATEDYAITMIEYADFQ